jgi:integrase/recombinase XerD
MQTPKTFETQLANFVEAMKVHGYSPATLRNYRASLGVFLVYLGRAGITDVRAVESPTVRGYHLWLQKQDYTGWTILARLQAVRRFFEHLEATQVVLLNPCLGQHPPKVPYRLPKTGLTIDEAKRVLEVPNSTSGVGLRDKAILEVFYSSGIRLEEMTRLSLADVDCKNGFLRVNQGKFAKDRVVPLGRTASDCVRRYIEQVRTQWSPPPHNQKALWLSCRQPHEPLKSQVIEVMVRRYGRLAGISKRLTPHLWRHTCASQLVASGANVAYVQRLLGHASLRTTQVYVHTTIPEIKTTLAQAHPRNQEIPE